ncbi:ATP-dependent DNA ligase [Phenylobacterium hankyongense]|uniref:DNA ligase (ATP) n=1 Tax=Phenylobacterium hankyongense TaxID=1813876 RepID=A0A328AUU2_9CAUL|nr:ATP-dependent DNA ligase [Phenylobacterium hankyongense]RAK58780.1 ATP-dependent DNA ligase [Phenylobacterium hankyongense]
MRLADLPVPLDLAIMEAKLVDEVPRGEGWRYEPKWDGFRCLAFRAGHEVELKAKSGKPLARYFPDVVAALKALPVERFVVDGELTISVDGELSFDALQLRLHPAESRVRKLAAEHPACFVLFDCLMDAKGRSLVAAPLSRRRAELEALFARLGEPAVVRLSPGTEDHDEACGWLREVGAALDGVVAKRLDEPYQPGERAMLKIKRMRTADCVVGGFRYAQGSRLVGSLLLGLYDDDGRLDHVGFCSTISNAERPELTRKLEALAGGPGFTGRAPGGPSRWSNERSAEWTPLRPELVVEVRYDHVTGDRFRHGTKLVRWRPDKAPGQCTLAQLRAEAAPGRLMAAVH